MPLMELLHNVRKLFLIYFGAQGINVFVQKVEAYLLDCTCDGLLIFPAGLAKKELIKHTPRLVELLLQEIKEDTLAPDIILYRKLFGSETIVESLDIRHCCENCWRQFTEFPLAEINMGILWTKTSKT